MNSLSLLFSGRGSNANSIINYILNKKLSFKINKIVCNNINAPGISLLENLLSESIAESEVDKKYRAIVRSCDNFYNKYNTIFPINNNNGILSISPEYQDCIERISNSDDGLLGLVDNNIDNKEDE